VHLVFRGAIALVVLGILLYFVGVATSWVVFCVSLGIGIILIGSKTTVAIWIGISLLIIACIAFLIAINENDKQQQVLLMRISLYLVST